MPTTINNVETLAAVPHIMMRGGEWYKGLSLSNPKSTGTKLISVCGHIQRPGNYEVTMGTPMKELIYDMCGGMRPGRTLKAVIPGEASPHDCVAMQEIDSPPSDPKRVGGAGGHGGPSRSSSASTT